MSSRAYVLPHDPCAAAGIVRLGPGAAGVRIAGLPLPCKQRQTPPDMPGGEHAVRPPSRFAAGPVTATSRFGFDAIGAAISRGEA